MSEWKKGDLVTYRHPTIGGSYKAQIHGFVEGWLELLFADGSTCIVRPSRVEARGASHPSSPNQAEAGKP